MDKGGEVKGSSEIGERGEVDEGEQWWGEYGKRGSGSG